MDTDKIKQLLNDIENLKRYTKGLKYSIKDKDKKAFLKITYDCYQGVCMGGEIQSNFLPSEFIENFIEVLEKAISEKEKEIKKIVNKN